MSQEFQGGSALYSNETRGGGSKTRCARCGRCIWFPIRVFGLTIYRWWPQILPNFILWFSLIIVLAVGLKLNVGQNVLDLNDNLSQRGTVWYVVSIATTVMICFYVCEYVRESDKIRKLEETDGSTLDASGTVFVLKETDVADPYEIKHAPGFSSTVSVDDTETI